MKKLTALFLILAMVMSLAACGNDTTSSDEPSTSETSATQPSGETAPVQQEGSDGDEATTGNTLVVYFSATGNTEQAATYIAGLTGGDLFELEPAEPYTSDDLDWTDDNSRVSQEYYDESLRNVELTAGTVDNWDSYDTIFIGYPIWLAYHKLIQCTQIA